MDTIKLKRLNAMSLVLIILFSLLLLITLFLIYTLAQKGSTKEKFEIPSIITSQSKLRPEDAGVLADVSNIPPNVFYAELSAPTIRQKISDIKFAQPMPPNMKELNSDDLPKDKETTLAQESLSFLQTLFKEPTYSLIKFVPIHVYSLKELNMKNEATYLVHAQIVIYRESKMYALAFDMRFYASDSYKLIGIEDLLFTGYINEYDAIATPGEVPSTAETSQAYTKSVNDFEAIGTILPRDKYYADLILQQQAHGLRQDRGLAENDTH